MSAIDKPVQYFFSSGTFDKSFIQAVYESLRSVQTTDPGTGVFRDILANIPNNLLAGLGGDSVNGIVITDEYLRISSNPPPPFTGAASVVDGKLVVWLNPAVTSTIGGREQSIAETLAHEFADWTTEGQTKTLGVINNPGSQAHLDARANHGFLAEKALAGEYGLSYPGSVGPDNRPINIGRPSDSAPVYTFRDAVNCFAAGTAVLMADGTEKPIEAIVPGDMVMAFDGSPGSQGRLVPLPRESTLTRTGRREYILIAPESKRNLKAARRLRNHTLVDEKTFRFCPEAAVRRSYES